MEIVFNPTPVSDGNANNNFSQLVDVIRGLTQEIEALKAKVANGK